MKHVLVVCLLGLTLIAIAVSTTTQSTAQVPLQKGISVDMPFAASAVPVPSADKEDAAVMTITGNGRVYFGINPVENRNLAGVIRRELSRRSDKTLYIKADTRAPFADVLKILDAAHTAGVETLTLLTVRRNSETRASPVPPSGLELQLVHHSGSL